MPFRENLLAAFSAYFSYIPTSLDFESVNTEQLGENSVLLQATTILSESTHYKNTNWSSSATSDPEFIQGMLLNLLPNLNYSLEQDKVTLESAADFVSSLLQTNTRAEVLYLAIESLLNTNSPSYHDSRSILLDKISFSEFVIEQRNTIAVKQNQINELMQLLDKGLVTLDEAKSQIAPTSESWHFMVYMMADNNLEVYGLADLQELSDLAAVDQVTVSVVIDRSEGYTNALENWSDTRYGNIQDNQTISEISNSLSSAGEINMGASQSLTAFIDWSVSQNPADHYALVLWDHGLGYEGIGIDEGNHNDALTLDEISTAVKNSSIYQLDQLIFDACSMAMIEVGSALASVTDYIVASQDIVPSVGINYTSLANQIDTNQGIVSSRQLGDMFVSSYEEYFTGLATMALSVLDSSKVEVLTQAANNFAETVLISTQSDWSKIQMARQLSEYYYDNQSIDIHSFLSNLIDFNPSQSLLSASESFLEAAKESVINNIAEKQSSNGLSVYWPSSDMGSFYQNQYEQVIGDLGIATWGSLLENYWEM